MNKNVNSEQLGQKYNSMVKEEEQKLKKINQDIKIIEQ
jgi:hypothetical protein